MSDLIQGVHVLKPALGFTFPPKHLTLLVVIDDASTLFLLLNIFPCIGLVRHPSAIPSRAICPFEREHPKIERFRGASA
jgi:hypothetical protein